MLSNPFARLVLVTGVIEAALAWGAFAYIGADLHARFKLSFTLIGITVACFGVGGLIYAALVKHFVYRFGQTGLTLGGGLVIAPLISRWRSSRRGGLRQWRRPRSGSDFTCFTTRCRPKPRR